VPCDGSSTPCCRHSSAPTAAARDCFAARCNRVDGRDHARIASAPQACRCPRAQEAVAPVLRQPAVPA
jgi:hypothetical protein